MKYFTNVHLYKYLNNTLMKLKKILFTLFFILNTFISFSQQIGDGYAPVISDFNKELLSGFYSGLQATGKTPDSQFQDWNHLLNLRHPNPSNNHQLQIACTFAENDRLFFRKFARGIGTADPQWNEIATREGNTFNGNQYVNGNVGIGTTIPASKLDVRGVISTPEIAFRNADGGDDSDPYRLRKVQGTSNNNWLELQLNDDPNESFRIYGNSCAGFGCVEYSSNLYHSFDALGNVFHKGNVGIGTQNPIGKFDVRGNVFIGTTDLSIGSVGSFVQIDQGSPIGNSYSQIRAYSNGGNINNNLILQSTDGNVGIGTTTPDEKLAVNGNIHAKEVRVDLVGWPDYVFQKYYTGKSELKSDYSMPTLAEIESFTKKNHHLPNVPSAQQIKQNGLSLGEMSNVLLQKVEELTLYAIEQNKVIEELKNQVAILMAKKQ